MLKAFIHSYYLFQVYCSSRKRKLNDDFIKNEELEFTHHFKSEPEIQGYEENEGLTEKKVDEKFVSSYQDIPQNSNKEDNLIDEYSFSHLIKTEKDDHDEYSENIPRCSYSGEPSNQDSSEYNVKIEVNFNDKNLDVSVDNRNRRIPNKNSTNCHEAEEIINETQSHDDKSLQILNDSDFLNVKQISDNILFKYISEFWAKFLYLREFLEKTFWVMYLDSTFDRFSPSLLLNHIKESDLIDFIDSLLKYNEIHNVSTIDFKKENQKSIDFTHRINNIRSSISKIESLINKNKDNQDLISEKEEQLRRLKNRLKSKESKYLEFNSKYGYIYINNKIKSFTCKMYYNNVRTQSWCIIFETVNKITNHYNIHLRNSIHKYLINLDLSFMKNNQKYIKYSNYQDSPNYIAYMLVDILMNIFISKRSRNPLFISNCNEQNILLMHLNILLFLCLNNEKLVHNFINDKARFNRLTSIMKMKMMESLSNNEFNTEISKMSESKDTFTLNLEFYNNLKKNQICLGRFLEKFYELSYEAVLASY